MEVECTHHHMAGYQYVAYACNLLVPEAPDDRSILRPAYAQATAVASMGEGNLEAGMITVHLSLTMLQMTPSCSLHPMQAGAFTTADDGKFQRRTRSKHPIWAHQQIA